MEHNPIFILLPKKEVVAEMQDFCLPSGLRLCTICRHDRDNGGLVCSGVVLVYTQSIIDVHYYIYIHISALVTESNVH